MQLPVRRIRAAELEREGPTWPMREWLVTNGLGGYAAGTVVGVATSRYHGLLIAALPAPRGRWLLLSHLVERLLLADGRVIALSGESCAPGDPSFYRADHLAEFRLEGGLPVWRYEADGFVLERQLWMIHEQNTVYVMYRLIEGETATLRMAPLMHSRPQHASVSESLPRAILLSELDGRFELSSDDAPTVRLAVDGASKRFTIDRRIVPEVLYPFERARGYQDSGMLWSPGYFDLELRADRPVALIASTEPWELLLPLAPREALRTERQRRGRLLSLADRTARSDVPTELILAADQFVVRPVGRTRDAARARARGDDARSLIAGYHWFTDWGRDTMIALEGLTLLTGRTAEAGVILRTFAAAIRKGLLPNLFPEGQESGLYHTADATLWLFHALHRYLAATGDEGTLELLLPQLVEVAELHVEGTDFGIGADLGDGLLRQGAPGYQLTWMDAKVDDWVVTPRRGKAVEINALWYNALRLLAGWLQRREGAARARPWQELADRVRASFNRRFWNPATGHLFDVVDGENGDDASCRPNQVLALSLDHPALAEEHWRPVVTTVRERLVTPYGLRSLAPGEPAYQPRYDGDIYARDAAYHQGTVWTWLIGPFVDAWLRTHPGDRRGARQFLHAFEPHLSEACVGSISEIFDADPPFAPRGCVAQAWSVAEVLRAWIATTSS